MKYPLTKSAVALLAACILSPCSMAQTIYRCDNSYSQTPCPGAVTVDANDSRTPAQQAQAKGAASSTARLADTMEADRVALERAAAAPKPAKPLGGKGKPKAKTTDKDKNKGNAEDPLQSAAKAGKTGKPAKAPSPYFTAAVQSDKAAAEKPKKKAPKKSAKEAAEEAPGRKG